MNTYIHQLFFAGEGLFAARMAVYGTAHVRVLPLKDSLTLRLTRQALKGFSVVAPDAQRDPCPCDVVLLIGAQPLQLNTDVARTAARAVAVCFDVSSGRQNA